MKSILIVGSKAKASIELYYNKYLNEAGMECEIFACAEHYRFNLINKIRFRLKDTSMYFKVNKALIAYCKAQKPDIVWVFKGIEIYPKTLKALKSLGIYLVNYNPDHPFLRTSLAHGGKNIEKCVPLYDLHFSYRKDLVHTFKEVYGLESVHLPFGYELDDNMYNEISKVETINKLCFIGTADKERTELLLQIADRGYEIDMYNLTYPYKSKLESHPKIKLYPVQYDLEFWKKIRAYKVQLNFLRKHNAGAHNQRTFEVPGAGGILLTEYSDEQAEFFEEGKEIFMYKNFENLIEKIDFILQLSPNEINEIRKNAKEVSNNNGYNYANRSKIVFENFKKTR